MLLTALHPMTDDYAPKSGLLRDERGSPSMGRALLPPVVGCVFAFIAMDAHFGWDIPDPAYVLLGTISAGLLAWVAGPRIAQHLEFLGNLSRGIGRDRQRLGGTDNRYEDVES